MRIEIISYLRRLLDGDRREGRLLLPDLPLLLQVFQQRQAALPPHQDPHHPPREGDLAAEQQHREIIFALEVAHLRL